MQQHVDSRAFKVGCRGTLSAPLSPRQASSIPECFFMVWPLVKWSIVHPSMSPWPCCGSREIHCSHQCIRTVITNMSVISGSLIQYTQSFKGTFVFRFCASGCSRATKLPVLVTIAFIPKWMKWGSKSSPRGYFPPRNLYVHGVEAPCNPPFPGHH